MLGEGKLASGVTLDREKSVAALQPLADKLDYNLQQAACGIIRIVGASMANAIREITIEQGIDPRSLKLLAFGGAGPMMGTQLANELDIDTIIIPPVAGNFSAWGLLASDLLQSAARTRQMELDDQAIDQVNQTLQELYGELQQRTGARATGKAFSGKWGSICVRRPGTYHYCCPGGTRRHYQRRCPGNQETV